MTSGPGLLKNSQLLVTIILCNLLLGACRGESISFHPYKMHENGGRNYLTKPQDPEAEKVIVGEQIVGIGFKDHYLVIKRLRLDVYECQNASNKLEIATVNSGEVEYWLIDKSSLVEHGPMDLPSHNETMTRIIGAHVPFSVEYSNHFIETASVLRSRKACRLIN